MQRGATYFASVFYRTIRAIFMLITLRYNKNIWHLLQANHALLEEIREINQRLIDTVVDISDEDADPTAAGSAGEGGEGTVVKCSFSAVALSPNLKSQYASAQMVRFFAFQKGIKSLLSSAFLCIYSCFHELQSPIQPLRLLVPTNYPNCSPILLDKFPVEIR